VFYTDIRDPFSEYGCVKNIHLNLDRRSGFCKGYALVEYNSHNEAQSALKLHDTKILGKSIQVEWAFVKPVYSTDVHRGENRGCRKKMRTR